jgi:hypothetical protein
MKERITNWVAQRSPMNELLGCGVSFPDRSACARSFSAMHSEAVLEKICRAAGETVNAATGQHLPAAQLRWIFEGGVCHLVPRSDGLCLVFVTTRSFVHYDELSDWAAEFSGL